MPIALLAGAGEVLGSIGGAIGGVLSGLFGGNDEDKSVTGFNNFLQSQTQTIEYPSRDELLRVGTASGWPQNYLNAIQNSYNQSTGTFQMGDWRAIVIGTAPTQIKWFKGAGESFVTSGIASNLAFKQTNSIAESGQDGTAQRLAFGQKPLNGTNVKQETISSMTNSPIFKWVGIVLGGITVLVLLFKALKRR